MATENSLLIGKFLSLIFGHFIVMKYIIKPTFASRKEADF